MRAQRTRNQRKGQGLDPAAALGSFDRQPLLCQVALEQTWKRRRGEDRSGWGEEGSVRRKGDPKAWRQEGACCQAAAGGWAGGRGRGGDGHREVTGLPGSLGFYLLGPKRNVIGLTFESTIWMGVRGTHGTCRWEEGRTARMMQGKGAAWLLKTAENWAWGDREAG